MSEQFKVTLPADVQAARVIHEHDPMVNEIIRLNAEDEGVPVDEYLRYAAGQTVEIDPERLGLFESCVDDVVEVSLTGTFQEGSSDE